MTDTLSIEILCWIFFAFTSSITLKAHKEDWKIVKYSFGAISIILAVVGLLGLFMDLSPYLTINSATNHS